MQNVLRALADPTIRGSYLIICFAILVLPMIALSYWYHSRIKRTEGGQELMMRQARTPPYAPGSLSKAFGMARDIASGKYGNTARTMQNRVYWFVGLWVIANIIGFGILLWADEVNRGPT